MRFAGRAPEMEPFQALVGTWNVAQQFYRPKRGIWENGPNFSMTFTARYEGMFIDSNQVIPFTKEQNWRNTLILSYDKFRRVFRLAMMDGVVGLMDIFEGVYARATRSCSTTCARTRRARICAATSSTYAWHCPSPAPTASASPRKRDARDAGSTCCSTT